MHTSYPSPLQALLSVGGKNNYREYQTEESGDSEQNLDEILMKMKY